MRLGRVLARSLLAMGVAALSPPWAAAEFGVTAGPPISEKGGSASALEATSQSGPFYGFSAASGAVWIDDYRYGLHPQAKVVGNSTKMGLLSAIKLGEVVEFFTIPDPGNPHRKLVVEIRRK